VPCAVRGPELRFGSAIVASNKVMLVSVALVFPHRRGASFLSSFPFSSAAFAIVGCFIFQDGFEVPLTPEANILPAVFLAVRLRNGAGIEPAQKSLFVNSGTRGHSASGVGFHIW
jgi:hypothetical protein